MKTRILNTLAATLLHLGRPAEAPEHERNAETGHGFSATGSFVTVSALIQLGRLYEAAERLLIGLDRAPDDPQLRGLQTRLLADHPDPDGYRNWLEAQLAAAPDRAAAAVIRPLLRLGFAPNDRRGSTPRTVISLDRLLRCRASCESRHCGPTPRSGHQEPPPLPAPP